MLTALRTFFIFSSMDPSYARDRTRCAVQRIVCPRISLEHKESRISFGSPHKDEIRGGIVSM
jgi:hypothetical protein